MLVKIRASKQAVPARLTCILTPHKVLSIPGHSPLDPGVSVSDTAVPESPAPLSHL